MKRLIKADIVGNYLLFTQESRDRMEVLKTHCTPSKQEKGGMWFNLSDLPYLAKDINAEGFALKIG